jgi:ankyrin repeat protein
MFRQINRLIDEYDLAAIRRLVGDHQNVDARSKYGWTPLMLAASRGHQSVISLLLDAGADVNAVSEHHGYTALALAAQKAYVQVVEKLLAAGAKAQVPETFFGGSLLNYVKSGPGRENARISELLTQAGAK